MPRLKVHRVLSSEIQDEVFFKVPGNKLPVKDERINKRHRTKMYEKQFKVSQNK